MWQYIVELRSTNNGIEYNIAVELLPLAQQQILCNNRNKPKNQRNNMILGIWKKNDVCGGGLPLRNIRFRLHVSKRNG